MAFSYEINPRLIANVPHESEQILEPIHGYEQEPLVSLEKACQSLDNVLGTELKLFITVAKLNSKEPKDGLTQDESASIYLYTMEWNETEKNLYNLLNLALCATDRSQLQPWWKYLKLFFTALFKLPCTEYYTVWRGVPGDLTGLYREGDELTWWSLTSATSSFDVLQSPMYLGRAETRTMFSIQTKNGKLIRAHSHLQNDDEILLLPGIVLKVTGSENLIDGVLIIYLREIEAPGLQLAAPFDLGQINETSLMRQPSKMQEIFVGVNALSNAGQYQNPALEEMIQLSEMHGKLSLDSMHLNDGDMEIVARLGINDKKCKTLLLRNNDITSIGASILAEAIICSKALKSLVLDGNRISDSGVESLAKALANENIGFRSLILCSVGMTDVSCDHLAEMIRINHWVMYLYLNNNKIGDPGVRVLCETIRSRNCGITLLALSDNKLLTDASLDALCFAISENSGFHQIHLRNCSLSTTAEERLRITAKQRGAFVIYL